MGRDDVEHLANSVTIVLAKNATSQRTIETPP